MLKIEIKSITLTIYSTSSLKKIELSDDYRYMFVTCQEIFSEEKSFLFFTHLFIMNQF